MRGGALNIQKGGRVLFMHSYGEVRRDEEVGKGHGRKETLDECDDLVAVLIAENPVGRLPQILEGDDFVGVNESNDVFNNLLVQKEVGGPEVK